MTPIYHLESEKLNSKNYLAVRVTQSSAVTDFLIKEHARNAPAIKDRFLVAAERSFEMLKKLAVGGKLVYREKKIVVDPFSKLDFYFEGEGELIAGHWKLGSQSGPISKCEWVFFDWALIDGFVRAFKDEISPKWIAFPPQVLKGPALAAFLSDIEGDVQIQWKTQAAAPPDPLPVLALTDRHGGFANLWFDYGDYGTAAAHDPSHSTWRNLKAEKALENDLLETDFCKKIVDQSHYYCPLDKVAKSLTFLLEIGWKVTDCRDRSVLRQKGSALDTVIGSDKITLRATLHYDNHRADLKDMVGAFNRRENFIELSPDAVALIDRENFSQTWGDFADQEITSDGIALKKNRFGLLLPLLEGQVQDSVILS
ncbi:MAG: hypothetical protein HYX67_15970 [Candidatus Melainabacteria bacterium]|nr:hypothetical protein [Candidatus Melainabacteria bacterium]